MKRFWMVALIILLVVALGAGAFMGYAAYAYHRVTEAAVPAPTLVAHGQRVQPDSYRWTVPVAWGLRQKEFFGGPLGQQAALGEVPKDGFAITFPEGYLHALALYNAQGTQLWAGSAQEWAAQTFTEGESYRLEITSSQPKNEKDKTQAFGSFVFVLLFEVPAPPPPEPVVRQSAGSLPQGDVLAVWVQNLPEGQAPALQTDANSGLRATQFVPDGEGGWFAYVPTNFNTSPGNYTLLVRMGETEYPLEFTVESVDFPRQDMEIDLSNPVISEANSQEAYDQYNNTIPPLWEQPEDQKYFAGSFSWPCQAWLSTEYGFQRYTNGSAAGRPHSGLDIAAGEGTPVLAPAAGHVVFADYLLNTGYTIVIEHGAGIKSVYYHMSAIEVAAGDIVAQGHTIGAVGTTGYSTGPHLHFEIRVLNVAINPSLLLDGTGGLVYFEQPENAA